MPSCAALNKLQRRVAAVTSLVCVGLDPEIAKIPVRFHAEPLPLFAFCRWIIDQTHEVAAAYKPNVAFFEARGVLGQQELEATIAYLRERHPDILTILDAKRADIGNTNRGYVDAIFDAMGFDAVTLHPYLGREALEPFLARQDKLSIILCRTSNAGAGELQDLVVGERPLWHHVAAQVAEHWSGNSNTMLVVGATWPGEMRQIRAAAPGLWFLVPGIGAQGGDVAAVVEAGQNAAGAGLLLSSSRAILYSDDPHAAALQLRDAIAAAREVMHAR